MEYSDKELSLLVNSVVARFITVLGQSNRLVSVFSIGSMANNNYNAKQFNDFDLRIVVTSIDSQVYALLKKTADQYVSEFSPVTRFSIAWNDIIGPARFIVEGHETLLIHVIPLTLHELSSLPTTHKLSYSKQYQLFYGKDVLLPYKSLKLDKGGIIFDTEGIEYCKECIINRQFRYSKWTIRGSFAKLTTVEEEFNPNTNYEFLRYSVIKCFDNVLAYFIQEDNPIAISLVNDISANCKGLTEVSISDFIRNDELYRDQAIGILDSLESILINY